MEKEGHEPRLGGGPVDVEGKLRRLVETFIERWTSQHQSRPTVQRSPNGSARRKAFLGIDSRERQTAKELSEIKKQIQELKTLSAAQREVRLKKLPRKTLQMTKYYKLIDHAGLTDVQRECFLLKLERHMSVAEIARHKDKHHSTIQEHLRRASERIERLK
jgi:hypothetical protein